jgi:uncharacterized protein with HEPN domain
MRRSVLKLLEDIRVAAASIQEYTQGFAEADFLKNKPIRRAVEREFEIIGEALRRLSGSHPDVSARITEMAQIISFRNVLAHGYDAVADQRVWQAVTTEIPILLAEVKALMEEEQARQ